MLLNNDCVLLEQPKNRWLNQLDSVFKNPDTGVSCVIKGFSEPANHYFAIFFCVMIHRKVFEKIGLLNEEYGIGGGEDTEFCIEAERAGFKVTECVSKQWSDQVGLFVGDFPIYHRGEGTMHDPLLVPKWDDIFFRNSMRLAKKYNISWYKEKLNNNFERAIFLKGDHIDPRESARYTWAADNVVGSTILEIGCSTGYGSQFFPGMSYIGLDYDKLSIEVAQEQKWGSNCTFMHADINRYPLIQYDTIIAFEVIEHLDNGLEIAQMLKKHCKRLMISVPWNEPPGFWGEHHKLHMLNESHLLGFTFAYVNEAGNILSVPEPITTKNNFNLMLGMWTKE